MSFYKEEIPLARLNLWEILFFFNISQFFEFEHKFEIWNCWQSVLIIKVIEDTEDSMEEDTVW